MGQEEPYALWNSVLQRVCETTVWGDEWRGLGRLTTHHPSLWCAAACNHTTEREKSSNPPWLLQKPLPCLFMLGGEMEDLAGSCWEPVEVKAKGRFLHSV